MGIVCSDDDDMCYAIVKRLNCTVYQTKYAFVLSFWEKIREHKKKCYYGRCIFVIIILIFSLDMHYSVFDGGVHNAFLIFSKEKEVKGRIKERWNEKDFDNNL